MLIRRRPNIIRDFSRALTVLVALSISASGYAQNIFAPCHASTIYTLNGIFTDRWGARANAEKLRDFVMPSLSAQEATSTEFGFIWNDTSELTDLLANLLQNTVDSVDYW